MLSLTAVISCPGHASTWFIASLEKYSGINGDQAPIIKLLRACGPAAAMPLGHGVYSVKPVLIGCPLWYHFEPDFHIPNPPNFAAEIPFFRTELRWDFEH